MFFISSEESMLYQHGFWVIDVGIDEPCEQTAKAAFQQSSKAYAAVKLAPFKGRSKWPELHFSRQVQRKAIGDGETRRE